jgi:hypothetical protein
MIKFQAMMGRIIEYALPKFIDLLELLIDVIEKIPGIRTTTDTRSGVTKQEDKAYENAGVMQHLGFGTTEAQDAATKARVQEQQNNINKFNSPEELAKRSKAEDEARDKVLKFFGFRAQGGPVKANAPYIVGEKGPELFVPNGAGNIVANNDLQQNAGMLSMPNMPDMSAEYKKIDLATKDIVADIQKMAKYDDLRATNTKTFTEKYTDYTKSVGDLLDQDLVNMTQFMEAGGTSSVSSAMSSGSGAGGGQGIKPGGSGAPGLVGGDSLQGLKMKKGDVPADGAGVHPKLVEMAKQVQANMPNFAYFSAFNDEYHQEKSPSSFHTKGLAMDFALSKAPTKEEGQAIVKYLQSIGASTAIDEYNNPSSKSTAGHIHAQIPGFADGGISMEPNIAMVPEKSPEVMMPLTNDGFLGQLNTSINSLLPQQERMVSLLEDMGRSMQATAAASERMAAVASN